MNVLNVVTTTLIRSGMTEAEASNMARRVVEAQAVPVEQRTDSHKRVLLHFCHCATVKR